jgi:predicted amidohydrolase
MQGARIVYYISSESGLLDESKLAPYRAQMVARAVENNVFVVAANSPAEQDRIRQSSHGQSRIIGTNGAILKEASFFGEDILIETLIVRPGKLSAPLKGPLGQWWQQGLEWMMQNRTRQLE